MQFFYWNESFEIGIADVDRQHRRLVDLINELAASIMDGALLPDVQTLFGQLMEYAAEHFRDEELLLSACCLTEDDKQKHINAHRGFVKKAKEIMHRPDLLHADAAEHVLEFLTTWLVSHILGSDREIARSLSQDERHVSREQALFEISPVERILLCALSETERRFRLITNHTPALIWVSDAAGKRGFFNRAWTDFTGLAAEPTQAIAWQEFIHPDDLPGYLALLERLLANPQRAETEFRMRSAEGDYHWFLEKTLPRIDTGGVFLGMVAAATDISDIKQAEMLLIQTNNELEQEVSRRTAQLEQLMLTDPLTGVGNRRYLMSRLEDEILRARRYMRPLSIMFFDIDYFKRINDTYGHAIGDMVLSCSAEALRSCLRECDQLGRYGGEEFVVLLPETSVEEAVGAAERMRAAIAGMQLAQIPETLTVSAGLAEWIPGESGDSLLQRSDRAMYQAKNAGRNRYCVDMAH